MNIENISSQNKILTLKPLPPHILYCKRCKTEFTSSLKMNAEFYKTCDQCRHEIRVQGRKHKNDIKLLLSNLK